MDATQRPAVVIDNGSGSTKLGFGGNVKPSYILPTAIGLRDVSKRVGGSKGTPGSIDDLDFAIGDEALHNAHRYAVQYPVRGGVVEDWDLMERFWQQSICKYMRVDPEEHFFLLTEPPLNPPEHREETAEIMFETFGVAGLQISVQAVLALAASMTSSKSKSQHSLSGTVIDSGDGGTYVVPVHEGYVIGALRRRRSGHSSLSSLSSSCHCRPPLPSLMLSDATRAAGSSIKTVPIAGKDLTLFVHKLLRERGVAVPAEDLYAAAQVVKEQHCYTCSDVSKEPAKFDSDPAKYARELSGINKKTNRPWSFKLGHERFLTPEVFFEPKMLPDCEFFTPLPEVVDGVVASCPIDARRGLYNNIVLAGGSTQFKDFGRRLERDVKRLVDERVAQSELSSGGRHKAKEVEVNVVAHKKRRYAAWFGGSFVASMPTFFSSCHTKADYEEYGPSICRSSHVFRGLM
mmetsp:Transcript_7885/g.29197  ORF Transcript_7885/g.29197 Transcript_7885/m.29197 type:complete len:460 (+) Transcript_7885:178-1557(+)